ncbi:MAG: tetratricopeptide repeat protein [Lentisphaeria bacterium]|nr:tetratricopeptide repeat protein [Lentisphaeria bacterium]
MDHENSDVKYYAFISYSRCNSNMVAYLHRRLENFRIPRRLSGNIHPDAAQRRFLRPIFRDRRDLGNFDGNFTDDIKKAVAGSRYLIVLCSTEAAVSPWVEAEINYFLETHDHDFSLIVPVIAGGNPGSGDEHECLPESLRVSQIMLRNLPSMKPDPGEREKDGWENGVVQTLSYLLRVRREMIRAAVDAEKVRQFRIYAVIGVVAAIGFAGLTAWALNSQKLAENALCRAESARLQAEASESEAVAAKKEADAEKREALKQMMIARWSMDFLHSMFTFSEAAEQYSTDFSADGDIRNRILDAIEKKSGKIRDLPWEMQVEVSADFAAFLSNYALWDEAARWNGRALELNRANRPDSPATARSMMRQGRIMRGRNNSEEALNFFAGALEVWEKLNGEGKFTEEVITLNNMMGDICFDKGNYDQALQYHRTALNLCRQFFSRSHRLTAVSCIAVGNDLNGKQAYSEALEYHTRAVSVCEELYPAKNHLVLARARSCAANTLIGLERFNDALDNALKALDIRRSLLNEEDLQIASSFSQTGYIRLQLGDLDKALYDVRKSLACRVKRLGEKDPSVGMSYKICGEIYLKMSELHYAVEAFRKALDIFSAVYGPESEYAVECREFLRSTGMNVPEKDAGDGESRDNIREAAPADAPANDPEN